MCSVKVICLASEDHQQASQRLSSPNAFVPTPEIQHRVSTELLLLLSSGIPHRHEQNQMKAFSLCLHVDLIVVY